MMTEKQRERFAGAIDRMAGDEGMFLKVAAIASEDAPILISQSDSALGEQEFTAAAAAIHKLKGLLATFLKPNQQLGFDGVMSAIKGQKTEASVEKWQAVKPQLNCLMEEIDELPFR